MTLSRKSDNQRPMVVVVHRDGLPVAVLGPRSEVDAVVLTRLVRVREDERLTVMPLREPAQHDLEWSEEAGADQQQRFIGNAPNSEIRRRAHLEPSEAAQTIIALRAELDAIYAVVDYSDAVLYDAVKKSIARVKQWDAFPTRLPTN